MIFKRLAGNLIDFLIYILVFFILFKMSGLETDTDHLYYFYFISFLVTFLVPIILYKNTFGKQIMRIQWKEDKDLKLKLVSKYTFYYLNVAPSFSILSAISSFPLFNPIFENYDKVLLFKLVLVFVIADIVVFVLSVGKFHIIDYALKLELNKNQYCRKPLKSLCIIYLFFGLLFVANLFVYKYNLTFSGLSSSFGSIIFKEQYPDDIFYGSYVFSVRDKSENVFSPTEPLSFIFKQRLPQKTLYMNLPEEVFNSESERKVICINLIEHSWRNNLFSDFKPRQTRIVLSNIKRGFFLEYYNYFYIYYFDNELPEWGIYSGIQADSITMRDYLTFNNNYNKVLIDKVKNIENKLKLPFNKILEKSENDSSIEKEVMSIYSSRISSTILYDKLVIELDTTKLELKKIDFTEAKLNGYMHLNFPISDLELKVNLVNLLNGQLFEYDDNVNYLKLLREEITNKGI